MPLCLHFSILNAIHNNRTVDKFFATTTTTMEWKANELAMETERGKGDESGKKAMHMRGHEIM